jgi:hypothetical protein
VPLNPLSQADGIIEDLDRPRTYLKNVLGDRYDGARVRAGAHPEHEYAIIAPGLG